MPIPVGQNFLHGYDEAVKRSIESKALNKAKVVPSGGIGVTSAMLILDQDIDVSQIPVLPFKSLKIAMLWIQAPMPFLHPNMCGDIAECKVPSSMVHGPTLNFQGQNRLVVALPQPVIRIFQEWLTTITKWKIVAQSHVSSSQVVVYTSKMSEHSPTTCYEKQSSCITKVLFWEAMEEITRTATLMSGCFFT